MNDKAGEKKWGLTLSASLERARQKPIFTGHEFFVTPSAAAQKGDTRPSKDEKFRSLEAVIRANGGQVCNPLLKQLHDADYKRQVSKKQTLSARTLDAKTHIISSDLDSAIWEGLASKEGIPVHNSEFIYLSILRQE